MMTAVNYLTVFERHLAPARRCRPYGILPLEGFIASLPKDLIQGDSGNTGRGNAPGRFAVRQTHQGEPSGREQINTLAVLPQRATQEHRVTGVTMKPAQQPERRGHREMARQRERVKAAHCLPGRCFAFELGLSRATRPLSGLLCSPISFAAPLPGGCVLRTATQASSSIPALDVRQSLICYGLPQQSQCD